MFWDKWFKKEEDYWETEKNRKKETGLISEVTAPRMPTSSETIKMTAGEAESKLRKSNPYSPVFAKVVDDKYVLGEYAPWEGGVIIFGVGKTFEEAFSDIVRRGKEKKAKEEAERMEDIKKALTNFR